MDTATIENLLETESGHISKLNRIVLEALEEEKLLSNKLYEFEDSHPKLGSRISDGVAKFGGSWAFIISFFCFMALWIGANVYGLRRPFDVYPFILLNLILSTLAAIQAPIIIMSQNRKEEKDRQRAVNDYLVNLKTEIEMRNLHQKIDLLITEQMKTLFETQSVQVALMQEIRGLLQSNTGPTSSATDTYPGNK